MAVPALSQYVPTGHGTGSVGPIGIVIVVRLPCVVACGYAANPVVGIV